MLPTDYLGLETDGCSRRGIGLDFGKVVALRVSSYAKNRALVGQGAVDGGEYERRSAGSGVLMRDETNRGEVLDGARALGGAFHGLGGGGPWC